MRVVRGSLTDVNADRAVTRRLTDIAEGTETPVVRVWTPPKQLAFGRRDTVSNGYSRARRIAEERGYEPIERSVGGRAVAYTGHTLAFAYAVPTADDRQRIDCRYRDTTDRLAHTLEQTGAVVSRGEPDRSFCPGAHSIVGTGKIAGVAQRVRKESALVGGCVIVSAADKERIARVLDPIYDTLDIPFDPDSVGSIEDAGGPATVKSVRDAIEHAFVGADARIEQSATAVLDTDER